MAAIVKQEDVIDKLTAYLGDKPKPRKNGDIGPDHVHISLDGRRYYFEAIALTGGKQKGKNQSDFWKAFDQAISRLNPNSIWGRADYVVVTLPTEFLTGWDQRMAVRGVEVWNRIGIAFPKLQIWFVGEEQILRYSWNDAYYAG